VGEEAREKKSERATGRLGGRDLPEFARLNDVVGQGKPGRVCEEMEANTKVEIEIENEDARGSV